MTRRNSSGAVSLTGARPAAIALLTHTSIGPSSDSIWRGGALDLVGIGDVGGRDARAAAHLLHLAARGLEPLGAARDEPDVCAARAISRAVARPIPAEAPVMTTTLPWSDMPSLYPALRSTNAKAGPRGGLVGPRFASALPVCWT